MLASNEILEAKILIVDDRVANVILLEKILANIGYHKVFSTVDPTAVCDLHREHHFDLILLDLQMPVMDGYAVMHALKNVEPESYTPVLVITAQPAEKLHALQAGAKDFVSKPFELVELKTRIANMLEVRLLYQKLANHNVLLEKTVEERTAQLRQSEARFKSFTKLSSDWYWEQDANGEFVSAEGPVFEMLGIHDPSDEADLMSTSDMSELASEGDCNQDEYAQLQEKIESRIPFLNYIYRRILQDGRQQVLQVSGEPIFDSGSRFVGYRGIGMELNDGRRTDTESHYLQMAFNSVEQALLIFDGVSKNLIDANDVACDLFVIAQQDIASFDLLQLGLSDLQSRDQEFLNLIATGGSLQENARIRKQSGECYPISIKWRAYSCGEQGNPSEKWIIVAAMSVLESITVFDGLD